MFVRGRGRRNFFRGNDVAERHGDSSSLGLDHAMSLIDPRDKAEGIRRHSVIEAIPNDDARTGCEVHHELGT